MMSVRVNFQRKKQQNIIDITFQSRVYFCSKSDKTAGFTLPSNFLLSEQNRTLTEFYSLNKESLCHPLPVSDFRTW